MAENVRLFINSESRLRYIELTWANGARGDNSSEMNLN
jgi:hypothetical protein